MQSLHLDLAERSYTIHIGTDLRLMPGLILPQLKGKQVMLITNDLVDPLYADQILHQLQQADPQLQLSKLVLPDGEACKDIQHVQRIWDALLDKGFNRNATLLALGGGVIGDMTGFAAACYQRGINFIQIPTTLLSQVDSSVGGKTGVNHPLGKNMLGAFWQPRLVLADITTLKTLPMRELSAGMAEVIKYGLLGDAEFLCWLEQNLSGLMTLQEDLLTQAILRCCQLKAEIVAADERENGRRALLNLGHTFGHAIETEMGYGNWLHGEAVAVGMWLAADLSRRIGHLDQQQVDRVAHLLQAASLPYLPPATMTVDDFLTHMAIDKKNIDGRLRLILLKSLGEAYLTDFSDRELLSGCLDEALQAAQGRQNSVCH